MSKVKSTKFRFIAFLLCALLVISGLVPVMGGIRVKATNNITIYFDTSGSYSTSQCSNTSSHGTHGWSKSMTTVYYYAYKKGGSAHTGLSAMTPTGVEGTDGGMIFSTTIDTDAYDRVLFSSVNPWGYDGDDKLWQTQGISISASSDKHRFITNGSTLNDPDDSYRHTQNVYDAGLYTLQTNNGDQWALANYTSSNVTLYLIYSTKAGVTEVKNYTVNAYTLYHDISVPEHDPTYTSVEIHKDSATGTLLKTYTLGTEKIPGSQPKGNVFIYGVTEYAETHSGIDGDGKVLNYWHARCDTTSGVTKKLYLSSSSFPSTSYNASEIKIKTKTGSYSVTPVTSNGNASFVTTSAVSAAVDDVITLEITKNGKTDKYHMVWDDDTNDLIEKPFDAALISGRYSAASVITNGITVNSEFFDYFYDDFYNQDEDSKSGLGVPLDWGYGNQRRPYATINEKISESSYGKSFNTSLGYNKTLSNDSVHNKPPMYLGGFWNSQDKNYYIDTNANAQYAANYNTTNYYDMGYSYLRGFRYGANLAYRPEEQRSGTDLIYNTVAQGLVDNQLGGDVKHGYTLKANGYAVPYFSESWWKDEGIDNFVWYKDNIPFPFYTTSASDIQLVNNSNRMLTAGNGYTNYTGNYYVFDAQKNIVSINKNTGETTFTQNPSSFVMDGYGDGSTGSDSKGFFPFNSHSDDRWKLNMGFGTRFDFDFYLNDAGTLNGEVGGIPITFTFQGDDDVWVFLDDQLILDMGGDHKNALGEINFSTKKIYISQVGYANTNLIEKGTTGTVDGVSVTNAVPTTWVNNNVSFSDVNSAFTSDSSYLKTGKHRLTMYYMERGMFNSNLFVMFNLPQDTTMWELQEDTDFDAVNNGFKAATKIVADYDSFNYSVENYGSDNSLLSSNYKYPSRDAVTRNNTESALSPTTNLSIAKTKTTVTTTEMDKSKIFLDLSGFTGWENDGATFAAFVEINGTYTGRLMMMNKLEDHLYYIDYDPSYTNIRILRIKTNSTYKGNVETFRSFDNDSDGDLRLIEKYKWNEAWWNRTSAYAIDIDTSNTLEITGWGGGDGVVSTASWKTENACKTTEATSVTTTTDSSTYNTYDYKSSGLSDYEAVQYSNSHGISYKLKDMFASPSNSEVVLNTRQIGNGYYNVVSLQYGQMAQFRKQFTMDSNMRVTQLDSLSTVLQGTSKNITDNTESQQHPIYGNTERLVSDYYDTYIKTNSNNNRSQYAGLYSGVDLVGIDIAHVEDMYGGVTNYSNESVANLQYTGTETTYRFRDPSDSSNRNVHLRQVFVNAVRTADLTIEKRIAFGESSSDSFTLHVYFSDVFGASYGDSQIGTISYTYYPNGGTAQNGNVVYNSTDGMSLSISAGDKIVITGIPVGTKYKITETYTGTPTYVLNEDESININANTPAEITGDTTAIVYNSRQTGKLDIYKRLYDENLSEITGSDMEFTVQLVLTNASVDIGNYSIIARSEGNVLAGTSIERITDPTDTKRLTLKMKIKGGVGKFIEVSGIPYGTTYAVQELTGSGFEFMNVSTAAYQDSTYNYAPGNAPVSGGNDYHIFKSINTSTVNDANVNKVTVVNKIIPIIMPTTGGSGIIFIFPLGILAITLSGAAFVIYTRRISSGKKAPKGRYVRK